MSAPLKANFICDGVTIGLVSPGAVTDGVTLFFPLKTLFHRRAQNIMTFIVINPSLPIL